MIGYAAEERTRWISCATDIELTRSYYDVVGSDIVDNIAMSDLLRGEMVRRFMMRSLEGERLKREQEEKKYV
ncbi:MAG: hypothetical protein KH445_06420 [Clostridium sp.]|nr:hypothetical protein [Clostridium sp.]